MKIYAIQPEYVERVQRRIERISAITRDEYNAVIEAAEKSVPQYYNQNGIALIRVRGIMEKFAFWSDEVSTITIKRAVVAAARDKKINSIMLVIDSPGGHVEGMAELEDAVYQARRIKPITAQVDGIAASGGYWLASQAGSIYAHRLDQVGSIGTYMVVDDFSKYFEKEGIKTYLFTTGDYKGAGIMGTEITDKQKKEFQGIVNIYYEAFLSAVSKGRNMDRDKIEAVADGRIFIGKDAVSKGLIDGIQTFEQTFAGLAAEQSSPSRTAQAEMLIRLTEEVTRT